MFMPGGDCTIGALASAATKPIDPTMAKSVPVTRDDVLMGRNVRLALTDGVGVGVAVGSAVALGVVVSTDGVSVGVTGAEGGVLGSAIPVRYAALYQYGVLVFLKVTHW